MRFVLERIKHLSETEKSLLFGVATPKISFLKRGQPGCSAGF
jgi:hypothetical protein